MRRRLFVYYFFISISIIKCISINYHLRRACAAAIQVLELSSIVPISSSATIREETHSTFSIPCNNYYSSITFLEPLGLIGSGGGGTVFSIKLNNHDEYSVLKISNLMSIKSVENECTVLRLLERKMKSSNYYKNFPLKIEKCLASCSPSAADSMTATLRIKSTSTDSEGEFSTINTKNAIQSIFQSDPTTRQVILLSPLFPTSRENINNYPASSKALSTLSGVWDISHEKATTALQSLAHTVVGMVLLGVASSDVQVLIDPNTGDSLLIDLTEARVMDNLNPTSFDLQLARNFISEFTSLMLLPDTDTDAVVPSDYEVTNAIRREIEEARLHFEGYADIPEAIKEMLDELYSN